MNRRKFLFTLGAAAALTACGSPQNAPAQLTAPAPAVAKPTAVEAKPAQTAAKPTEAKPAVVAPVAAAAAALPVFIDFYADW